MAVVRNLMIRVGADFSQAKKNLEGATRELNRFKRDTDRTIRGITGRTGLGRISTEFTDARKAIVSTLSQIRGAKGVGGVVSALGTLRPALSSAAAGFRGLGAAAGSAAATLGPVGIGLGIITAALAAVTVGIYRASQAAVQYEADLGRLQMQLKGNTREFMDWARSLGLARTSAAQMGATYSTLLSSFIRDNDELAESTKQLLQTTRVVASATGRSIEDVMERIRSGLLGNTEAIEDLGIFVNVSMIESTNAFRRFAGDKSWEQLTFQQQQQIRLAAILEQAYARYGDKLQNNVMTKQERLMEQLKEIKLNLSQAFLPIWDMILPALTRFSESLAWVTEQLARFFYAIRGWDYDERTRGIEDTTDAIQNEGDAYDDLADSAKKARKEIAAFDRLNLIGFDSGSGSGGGGGKGGSGGPSPKPPGKGPDIEWPMPDVPPLPRLRLEFDPPHPPDAGIGAVATAVTATMNQLAAQIRAQWAQTLADLQAQTISATPMIQASHITMTAGIRSAHETDSASVRSVWKNALAAMLADLTSTGAELAAQWVQIRNSSAQTNVTMGEVANTWRQRLGEMLQSLNTNRPYLEYGWYLIRNAARLTVDTLADVTALWRQRLGEMQQHLNAFRPYLEYGWYLIRLSVRETIPALSDVRAAWQSTLQGMASIAISAANGILGAINSITTAMNHLRASLNQAFSLPQINIPSVAELLPQSARNILTGPTPSLSSIWEAGKKQLSYAFSAEGMQNLLNNLRKEANKPENQAGLTLLSLLSGGGALKGAGQATANTVKNLLETLKRVGIAVPAFASGAVVSGPTLAMVGEYAGARTNPEVIAPLSDLESMIDSSRTNELLAQILRAIERGQNITVTISRDAVGRAAKEYFDEESRRGRNPTRRW